MHSLYVDYVTVFGALDIIMNDLMGDGSIIADVQHHSELGTKVSWIMSHIIISVYYLSKPTSIWCIIWYSFDESISRFSIETSTSQATRHHIWLDRLKSFPNTFFEVGVSSIILIFSISYVCNNISTYQRTYDNDIRTTTHLNLNFAFNLTQISSSGT